MHFTFKTCQIASGVSMTCQFHEFLNLFFGGFLQFGYTMRCLCTVLLPLCCHGPQCTLLQGDVKIKILQVQSCTVLMNLDFYFCPRVGERLCEDGFFFQNSFQLFLLLHCSFILEISLQPLLGIFFYFRANNKINSNYFCKLHFYTIHTV